MNCDLFHCVQRDGLGMSPMGVYLSVMTHHEPQYVWGGWRVTSSWELSREGSWSYERHVQTRGCSHQSQETGRCHWGQQWDCCCSGYPEQDVPPGVRMMSLHCLQSFLFGSHEILCFHRTWLSEWQCQLCSPLSRLTDILIVWSVFGCFHTRGLCSHWRVGVN